METGELIVVGVGSVAAAFSAVAGFMAVQAATAAIRAADSVAAMQRMLSQRQLIIPLWDYMSKLNDIDPENPVVLDVRNAVNTLELVAICCEGGMVDEQVIKRTFRDPFVQLYDAIAVCKEMPSLRRNGIALLRENPAAMSFYEKLKQEHMNRDKLEKV